MTMQNNIDIVRRNFRRNMLQPELQTFAPEVGNQRPVLVPIAIPPHDRQRRADCFEIEGDRGFANIAQVPDLIRVARKVENLLRQLIMGISENEDLHQTRKVPSIKPQIPGKLQYPKLKRFLRQELFRSLELTAWDFFGSLARETFRSWGLGFGTWGAVACFTCVGNF